MSTYERELRAGFEALERPVADAGFWDDEAGTFARARRGVRGERGFEPADARYSPFGLAGALRAHRMSGAGDAEKLRRASAWALRSVPGIAALDDLYYGGIWALVEAGLTWGEGEFVAAAAECVRRTAAAFESEPSLNLGVGLFALAELVGYGPAPDGLRDVVAAKAGTLARAVNAAGVPATGDRRAAYHQRMMYCAWGLAGAAAALDDAAAARAAAAILSRVVSERMDEDGGIRWHAILERDVLPDGGARIYPWGHHIYYECHQCFFANAVELYERATGDARFAGARAQALAWIFGGNRWRLRFDEHGVPGLPARCIAKDGDMSLWRNRFKGCYEVGAYLWALAATRDAASAA